MIKGEIPKHVTCVNGGIKSLRTTRKNWITHSGEIHFPNVFSDKII